VNELLSTSGFPDNLVTTGSLEIAIVVQALLLAFGLSTVVAFVYRLSVGDRVASPVMQMSFVLLALVAAMVMMVIGNNLARAFSLVGALSIVRFRTRLRSPWDITFVFFALTVGIGCGVFAWVVSIVGTGVVSLAVLALQLIPLGVRGEVRLLRVDLAAYKIGEGDLDKALGEFVEKKWLEEARSLRFGETLSMRYRVVLNQDSTVEQVVRGLSVIEGVERVVLVAHDEESSATEN
jgi:hypothetical protein